MHYLVSSVVDEASVNLRERLLEMADWRTAKVTFQGSTVLELTGEPQMNEAGPDGKEGTALARPGRTLLVSLRGWHLQAELLELELVAAGLPEPELLVFLSRHTAASGKPTLTVHATGNYGEAAYGGRPHRLSRASPGWMTGALRQLVKETRQAKLPHGVSYEVTHHGPYLETPSFYLEIGSDPTQWSDPAPARAVAKALLATRSARGPVLVGVGGGHYAPRFTEVVTSCATAFGHLVPAYALKELDWEGQTANLELAWQRTPGASAYYFHRQGLPRPLYRRLRQWAEERERPAISSKVLPPLVQAHD